MVPTLGTDFQHPHMLLRQPEQLACSSNAVSAGARALSLGLGTASHVCVVPGPQLLFTRRLWCSSADAVSWVRASLTVGMAPACSPPPARGCPAMQWSCGAVSSRSFLQDRKRRSQALSCLCSSVRINQDVMCIIACHEPWPDCLHRDGSMLMFTCSICFAAVAMVMQIARMAST